MTFGRAAAVSGWPTVGRAIALAALPALSSACDAAPETSPPPVRAGTIDVGAAEIYYQTIGTGPPIIVVHGGPGLDHSYLRSGLEPLGRTYRVVLYDQRGLGRSASPLDTVNITMSGFLTDIDRVRAQVAGTERAVLLSHSWGSLPTLLYAIEAPERVRALILVNPVEPGSRWAEETNARQAAARDSLDAAAIDSIRRTPEFARRDTAAFNRLFFHVFRGTFADPTAADTLLRLQLQPRTARQGVAISTMLMTPLQGLDFWDELRRIPVPVLIVHGAADPIPLGMVQALADALPDARVEVLEGAGHFPFLETPDAFYEAIRTFMEALDADPSSEPG